MFHVERESSPHVQRLQFMLRPGPLRQQPKRLRCGKRAARPPATDQAERKHAPKSRCHRRSGRSSTRARTPPRRCRAPQECARRARASRFAVAANRRRVTGSMRLAVAAIDQSRKPGPTAKIEPVRPATVSRETWSSWALSAIWRCQTCIKRRARDTGSGSRSRRPAPRPTRPAARSPSRLPLAVTPAKLAPQPHPRCSCRRSGAAPEPAALARAAGVMPGTRARIGKCIRPRPLQPLDHLAAKDRAPRRTESRSPSGTPSLARSWRSSASCRAR